MPSIPRDAATRIVEGAALLAITESDARRRGHTARARLVAMTIAASGNIPAAQDRFDELLEAALRREGKPSITEGSPANGKDRLLWSEPAPPY